MPGIDEVFTPSSFPRHTYVARANSRNEDALAGWLRAGEMIASVAGPSKTGKTVLVQKVAGVTKSRLVEISGARIRSPQDVWDRTLEELRAPTGVAVESESSKSIQVQGQLSIPGVGPQVTGQVGSSKRITSQYSMSGLSDVLAALRETPHIILIDDFHFVDREVQTAIARQLKEAAHKGLKIVVATVPHRSDDVVRSLPELRGRVAGIDVPPWEVEELRAIATMGFETLNLGCPLLLPYEFAKEAAGSPALMQAICREACLADGVTSTIRQKRDIEVNPKDFATLFTKTSSLVNMRSQARAVYEGAKLRGKRRQTFRLKDGSQGDVYYCVLRAIADNPAARTFGYNDLMERVSTLIRDKKKPTGRSVTGACKAMAGIAHECFTSERFLDWDPSTQTFDIVDPNFWFFLRWSSFLFPNRAALPIAAGSRQPGRLTD